MKVWEVLKQKGAEVETIEASRPISEAVTRFGRSKIRSLLVLVDGRLVGMLTIRDVLGHVDQAGAAALGAEVREAMSGDIISVRSDASLDDVEGIFREHHINHLPVLDDGELKGLLTPSDVLASHLRGVQHTNEALLGYISGEYF